MRESLEPELAPPGAGLPKVELMIARMIFHWRRMRGSYASYNARFLKERDIIRQLIHSCGPETGSRRVLIMRPRGLEDSSRYWSVWMTLDHLRIVHRSTSRIVSSLKKGIIPPGKASTADVKPDPAVTAAVISEYERSCDDLLAAVAVGGILRTTACFSHPWFGSLDAAGWHALAGGHMEVHRVQVERIVKGLGTVEASASSRPSFRASSD